MLHRASSAPVTTSPASAPTGSSFHTACCSPGARARWGGIILALCGTGCNVEVTQNQYQAPPPPEVRVTTPVQQTVTLFIEENGETEVVERAEVRARVRGFLEEIKFVPGQEVAEGDVLYVIERDQYQATVNSATAAVQAAAAAVQVAESQIGVLDVELTRAEQDFQRFKSLFEKEAATQSQYETALATRDAAVASKKAAQANTEAAKAEVDHARAELEQAQLDLDYTIVNAPISGRITKTEIKRGNLVDNGSLMATIVNQERMYANFNVNDRDVLELQKAANEQAAAEGRERSRDEYREVEAFLRREIDQGFPFAGRLDYVDAEGVDQATGTFAIRAVFDNSEHLILPGLFVRVRVPVGELPDALLIPEQAVARDQRGAYVLTVNSDNTVERRPVQTGQTFEGLVVVDEGLQPDLRVVVEGGQRARPGVEVVPVEVPPSRLEQPKRDPPTDTQKTADDALQNAHPTESSAQP